VTTVQSLCKKKVDKANKETRSASQGEPFRDCKVALKERRNRNSYAALHLFVSQKCKRLTQKFEKTPNLVITSLCPTLLRHLPRFVFQAHSLAAAVHSFHPGYQGRLSISVPFEQVFFKPPKLKKLVVPGKQDVLGTGCGQQTSSLKRVSFSSRPNSLHMNSDWKCLLLQRSMVHESPFGEFFCFLLLIDARPIWP